MEKNKENENEKEKLNYTIGEISPERWLEYKQLRLEALQNEPQAFAATYEGESVQPDSKWISRLQPSDDNANTRLFLKVDGKLSGMVSSFRHDDTPSVVEIVNVYINQKYRGLGLGKKLTNEIISRLKGLKDIEKVHLTVNCAQEAALRTYESLEFQIVSKIEDAIEYNGQGFDEYEMEKDNN